MARLTVRLTAVVGVLVLGVTGLAGAEGRSPLAEGEQTLYLRNHGTGCATLSNADFRLSAEAGEGEPDCGSVGNEAFNVAPFLSPTHAFHADPGDGIPVSLDASREATGTIAVRRGSAGVAVGLGQVVVEITLRGATADGRDFQLGSVTEERLMHPAASVADVQYAFSLPEEVDGLRFTSLVLEVGVRGPHVMPVYRQHDGKSFVMLPTVVGDEAPDQGTGPDASVVTPDDVVVVAVVDNEFSPYHWDLRASQMPQNRDGNPATDLPLDTAPDTWLPGFPSRDAFTSFQALPLTFEQAGDHLADVDDLAGQDAAVWATVRGSDHDDVHYNWIPGTKIVGAVDFAGNGIRASYSTSKSPNTAHGAKASSVVVGNMHGTCPECVVVLVTYGRGENREAAERWALSQRWIDVVTHSYGWSDVGLTKIYGGSDVDAQRAAVERGQASFWSAGNGQANAFAVPNLTYQSSSKGPDWLTTVGAVTVEGGSYTGSGKTVDLASVGSNYTSMGGLTVTGRTTFSGTSNATPVVAGMYARALWRARQALGGPSRLQADGVVAVGEPVACGEERPDCELGDGVLTRDELQARLFHGAERTGGGPEVSFTGRPAPATVEEYQLASEGHGSYFGRLRGFESWAEEEARILGPMVGTQPLLPRPDGEQEWMVVDSFCRQEVWGSWQQGAYVAGETALPGSDARYPLRMALESACPLMEPPP